MSSNFLFLYVGICNRALTSNQEAASFSSNHAPASYRSSLCALINFSTKYRFDGHQCVKEPCKEFSRTLRVCTSTCETSKSFLPLGHQKEGVFKSAALPQLHFTPHFMPVPKNSKYWCQSPNNKMVTCLLQLYTKRATHAHIPYGSHAHLVTVIRMLTRKQTHTQTHSAQHTHRGRQTAR